MKRFLVWFGLAAALCVQAAILVPELVDARLVVLANNLENYYYHPNSGRGNYTEAEIAAKTGKIVEMMLSSGAAVFAFCEVEAKPMVLEQLADSLNAHCGIAGRYAAVNDYIDEDWDEYYNNNIKAGFVYRTDLVAPFGSNYAATNVTYYKNTMRIQAWTELSSGERFTLSMNHFKAKFDDASVAKRVDNANWLMNALSSSSKVKDPDILIMGDLNCQMGEEALSIIQSYDYEEQLLRFDANAYSYVYYGTRELIDHAFANSSMAEQITGAAVWHTNTSTYYANRYSDHDAVMVGLRLGETADVQAQTAEKEAQKIIRRGQLIIIRGGVEYTITGQRLMEHP